MNYTLLKTKLKQAMGQSWAKILAKELNCSSSLVNKVCSGTKPDRKGIINFALEKIEKWNKQLEIQLRKLEDNP